MPPAHPAANHPAAAPAAAHDGIGAFRSGQAENRLRDLLAFALAAEDGRPPSPEAIEALRRQAEAELHSQAFRTLHNRVDEIRREAQDEIRARIREPAGFHMLVLANLIGFTAGGMVLLLLTWLLGGLG